MRLVQDAWVKVQTFGSRARSIFVPENEQRIYIPILFLLQEVRAQNMRFGVGWSPGLGRPQTLQKGEHHRAYDHQSSTNCHLSHQSGQNKSKMSCYKTILSPKKQCLGFSEKTASEIYRARRGPAVHTNSFSSCVGRRRE